MNRLELQLRLERFGVKVSQLTNGLARNTPGMVISGQLARSGTSPALIYAESQNAESTKDFVHKLRIGLKELRESGASLRMIEQARLSDDLQLLSQLKIECNELEAIFVSSINTVIRNQNPT